MPCSGSDVEGVGPNVVLKQMYYRDNTGTDLSWARTQLASLPACISSTVPPPQPPAFSSFDQFLSCTSYGILPDNLNLICFPSCLILISWCSPEVRHWWQLSYRIYTNNPVPLLSFFFFLWTKRRAIFFLHPPLHFPQCCFCFFLAV